MDCFIYHEVYLRSCSSESGYVSETVDEDGDDSNSNLESGSSEEELRSRCIGPACFHKSDELFCGLCFCCDQTLSSSVKSKRNQSNLENESVCKFRYCYDLPNNSYKGLCSACYRVLNSAAKTRTVTSSTMGKPSDKKCVAGQFRTDPSMPWGIYYKSAVPTKRKLSKRLSQRKPVKVRSGRPLCQSQPESIASVTWEPSAPSTSMVNVEHVIPCHLQDEKVQVCSKSEFQVEKPRNNHADNVELALPNPTRHPEVVVRPKIRNSSNITYLKDNKGTISIFDEVDKAFQIHEGSEMLELEKSKITDVTLNNSLPVSSPVSYSHIHVGVGRCAVTHSDSDSEGTDYNTCVQNRNFPETETGKNVDIPSYNARFPGIGHSYSAKVHGITDLSKSLSATNFSDANSHDHICDHYAHIHNNEHSSAETVTVISQPSDVLQEPPEDQVRNRIRSEDLDEVFLPGVFNYESTISLICQPSDSQSDKF